MDRVTGWRRIAAGVGVFAALGVLAGGAWMQAAGAGQPAEARWPPQFPREGATKLFENEHVIVWEQIGRPAEPFAHQHVRDILHFPVEPGRVEVFGPNLEPPARGGSFTEQIYARGSTVVSYSRAGLGPHVEMAPDPDNVPVSIFVEIKGSEPADCREWSTACQ